ncbi:HPr-rel-A system PqqD family peptide chaperone [Undibacterium sp. TJN25]|uniref:HPr-rel-A system PqqD family peptide chaperone n=1 Tax=Undibacterium sp. TJN25 TaxID=3413056 RepID=UPI003BF2B1B2
MKWQAAAGSSKMRLWGEEYVIYNARSGDSHLLGYIAGQVLLKLQNPLDSGALMEQLSDDWQFDSEQDAIEQIAAILADLDALALIERA